MSSDQPGPDDPTRPTPAEQPPRHRPLPPASVLPPPVGSWGASPTRSGWAPPPSAPPQPPADQHGQVAPPLRRPGRTAVCRSACPAAVRSSPRPGTPHRRVRRRTHRRTTPTAIANSPGTATRRRSGATGVGVRPARRRKRSSLAAVMLGLVGLLAAGFFVLVIVGAATQQNLERRHVGATTRPASTTARRGPRTPGPPPSTPASRTASSATTPSMPKADSPTATAPPRTSATPGARSRPPSTRL